MGECSAAIEEYLDSEENERKRGGSHYSYLQSLT